VGNTVFFDGTDNTLTFGGKTLSYTLNLDGELFSPPAGLGHMGNVGFVPSLMNGDTVLSATAVITAGFAVGLPPVSFVEPPGADTTQLASDLAAALVSGGYDAHVVSPGIVSVSGKGAALDDQFNLQMAPAGAPDQDLGPWLSVIATDTPEPASFVMLTTGILGFMIAARRPWRRANRSSPPLCHANKSTVSCDTGRRDPVRLTRCQPPFGGLPGAVVRNNAHAAFAERYSSWETSEDRFSDHS
jgi:hypothetical protein